MIEWDEVNRRRELLGLPPQLPYVAITAAGDRSSWKEWLHPRDRDGKWMEKLSRVKVFGRDNIARLGGMIESLNRDGSARVRITWSNNKLDIGRRVDVPSGSLEKIDAKAVLETPPPGEQVIKPQMPWAPFRPIFTGPAIGLAGSGDWASVQKALKGRDIIVFDTETTGLDVGPGGTEKAVELGAVRIRDGKVIDRFHTLVNPKQPIPPAASNVSGITDDDVKDAPGIAEAYRKFRVYAGDAILAAHNASFDMGVLDSMADESREPRFMNGVIDTLGIARAAVPNKGDDAVVENHQLGTLASYFDVKLDNWHRADADAEAAGLLLDRMIQWAVNHDRPTKRLQDMRGQVETWKTQLGPHDEEMKAWREKYKSWLASTQ